MNYNMFFYSVVIWFKINGIILNINVTVCLFEKITTTYVVILKLESYIPKKFK